MSSMTTRSEGPLRNASMSSGEAASLGSTLTLRKTSAGIRLSARNADRTAVAWSWAPRPTSAASSNHSSGGRTGSSGNRASASRPTTVPDVSSTMGW